MTQKLDQALTEILITIRGLGLSYKLQIQMQHYFELQNIILQVPTLQIDVLKIRPFFKGHVIFNYFAFMIKNKTKTLFLHLANCTPVVHSFRIRKARKFENHVAFARGLDFSKCQRVVGLLFTLLPLVKAEPRHLGFETSFDRHLGSQQQLRQQQHVLLRLL